MMSSKSRIWKKLSILALISTIFVSPFCSGLPSNISQTEFLTHSMYTESDFVLTEETPPKSILVPEWVDPPTNQTLEYGERFIMQLEIKPPEEPFAWFISDTEHFTIRDGVISDNFVLPVGVYRLTITVWDFSYSRLQSTIYIHVLDSHIPIVTSPDDITFMSGSSNHSITWTATDDNPLEYEITVSSVVMKQGNWTEEEQTFEVNVVRGRPGVYRYTLIVRDIGYNEVTDTVVVTILGNESTATDTDVEIRTKEFRNTFQISTGHVDVMQLVAIVVLTGFIGLISLSFMVAQEAYEKTLHVD